MHKLRVILPFAAMLGLGLLTLWAVLVQLQVFRETNTWTVATGYDGGSYQELGARLCSALNEELGPYEVFQAVGSAGSAENMERVGRGAADFAIVQGDGAPAPNARRVATLYEELVHVAVRSDLSPEIKTFADAVGLSKVSLGPDGSGTRKVAELLLEHFEVEAPSELVQVAPTDLRESFEAGELEAAVVLSGPGSSLANELFDSESIRLLSMEAGVPGGGSADAIALLYPAFEARLLPARLYGRQPVEAVHTIGVSALLIAAEEVDDDVVRDVTALLMERRSELSHGLDTPLSPRQSFEQHQGVMPIHAGAEAYHLRESPSFFVEYAEVISLALTLLVGLWSLGRLFVNWTANLKKERIDRFYAEITAARRLSGTVREDALQAIHDRAFVELMAERLAANESFLIFHNYLLSEMQRAERSDSRPRPI